VNQGIVKSDSSVDLNRTIRSRNQHISSDVRQNAPLVVRDWARTMVRGVPGVSASIDGFQVYFNGEALINTPDRADPFLAVSLLLAMYQRRSLDLTALPPVSAGLLANIEQVQEIWCSWNPLLRRVPILAREEATPSGSGAITFFSGGVDAVHGVLQLGERAGRLVTINGLDFNIDDAAFGRMHQRLKKLTNRLGRELLTIQTNWIDYNVKNRISHSAARGACMAAIAHMLQAPVANIASAHSWAALFPWGSHPLVDQHWSSDSVRIVHFGNDSTHLEKIAVIAQQPDLLKLLCVCSQDSLANCGKCLKCVQTRALLSILNADLTAFPPVEGDPLELWLQNSSYGMTDAMLVKELKDLVAYGHRKDLLDKLLRWERAALRRDVLRRLWRRLLPGMAAKRDEQVDLAPWGRGPRPEF
jgi:hypothetical protein